MNKDDDCKNNSEPPKDNTRRNFLIAGAVATAGGFVQSAGSSVLKKHDVIGTKAPEVARYANAVGTGATVAGVGGVIIEAKTAPISRRDALAAVAQTAAYVGIANVAGKSVIDEEVATAPTNQPKKPEIAPNWQALAEPKIMNQKTKSL